MINRATKVQTSNLTVHYPNSEKPALDSVTMTVLQSSFYTILGPNGSGKSSLLKAIMGLVKPKTGNVSINGLSLSHWTQPALAKEVAVVPQSETFAFPLTVRELVAMGRYPYLHSFQSETIVDQKAISASLKDCDIGHLVNRQLSTLSGGELQRVRIARSLAQEPEVLILDEPTANLDVRYEMSIFNLLKTLTIEGMTIILITHHLNLASEFSDHLLLLNQGKVVATGTPKEVLSESKLRDAYEWPIEVTTNPAIGGPQIRPLTTVPKVPHREPGNSQTDSQE